MTMGIATILKKTDNYEVLMQELTNGQYNTLSAHHFKDIRWMYFSKTSQSIYVVDYLKLKKVTLDGGVTLVKLIILKRNGASHAGIADRHYVFGVWTDKNENVYVAVYGAGKVKKIDLDGNISTVFESPIGWSPSGGLMADNGDMYIIGVFRSETKHESEGLAQMENRRFLEANL